MNPDAVYHPPLGEPVTAPARISEPPDVFDDPTLTLTESRIARENLAELAESLKITSLRFSRGTYKLGIGRGLPFAIERATLTECILRAHELNLELNVLNKEAA